MRTGTKVEILVGDCREVLRTLPDASVHCVVTSPPYFGLRDYGTATWEGGAAGCLHIHKNGGLTGSTLGAASGGHDMSPAGRERSIARSFVAYADICGKCGARRIDSQLGLEPTPEEYVAGMVQVFREVRRVLRADGVAWVNMGDGYATGGDRHTGRNDTENETPGGRGGSFRGGPRIATGQYDSLKPKDLIGQPWRLAFALQADGWWLRSDVIWAKLNPMPESVTDRPTKSHEYVFLFTKAARYFYDADAVREPHQFTSWSAKADQEGRSEKARGIGKDYLARIDAGMRVDPGSRVSYNANGRNLRTVWQIPTEAFPDAHFATYPTKLVEPCIKAGTSEHGVCAECGAPWERVVEREGGKSYAVNKSAAKRTQGLATAFSGYDDGSSAPTFRTTGWHPTCAHPDAERVPATVLDPFSGAGTTGLVANRLGRSYIGIELNPAYAEMARKRIESDCPLFVAPTLEHSNGNGHPAQVEMGIE